jgi:hypothetical protein
MAAISKLGLFLALGIIGGVAFAGCPAAAQQFSAEIVTIDAGGQPARTAGKLYVSNGVVHIETTDLPGSLLLVNANVGTAYLVRPAQRIFMDAKQSSRLTQILVPVDPDDPCKAWQVMARVAGAAIPGAEWHCDRIGPDQVAEHDAVKYRATSPQGQANFGWIDPQLNFPVAFQYQDGTRIELQSVREGPQPAPMFAIPVDYRKFDPQLLIERIKQSDVWVEPPK